MGIDVVLVVSTPEPLSDERIEEIRQKMIAEQLDVWEYDESGIVYRCFERDSEGYHDHIKNACCVKTLMRYYGRGYERGPLPDIIKIAEFLEREIPDGTVYYGGDCEDQIQPWPANDRAELLEYYNEVGDEPYRSLFSHFASR